MRIEIYSHYENALKPPCYICDIVGTFEGAEGMTTSSSCQVAY